MTLTHCAFFSEGLRCGGFACSHLFRVDVGRVPSPDETLLIGPRGERGAETVEPKIMALEKGESLQDLSHLDARELAIEVAKLLDGRRAEEISIVDVRKLLPITAYFVVASGTSARAVRMIGDLAEKLMRGSRFQKRGVEVDDEGRWICIDYQEVVVHLFDHDAREFYDFDRLWSEAPRVDFPRLGPDDGAPAD